MCLPYTEVVSAISWISMGGTNIVLSQGYHILWGGSAITAGGSPIMAGGFSIRTL